MHNTTKHVPVTYSIVTYNKNVFTLSYKTIIFSGLKLNEAYLHFEALPVGYNTQYCQFPLLIRI